jgi:MFS family permease
MLADYFPPQQLGRAVGTYASGLFLGGGLALVLGGAVVGALAGAESVVLPLVGELRVWQVAFIVVGLPGVLLSLLIMLTVREPPRRGVAAPEQGEIRPFFRQNAATLSTILGAFSLGGIAVVGCLAWIPEFIRRTHGWSIEQTGYVFGLTMAVFGTAGTLFGGWYLDRLTRRGHADAAIRASIIAFALLVPAMVLPAVVSDAFVSVALLAPLMFLIGMQQGYSPVALQLIAPNQLRARVVAIFFLVAQVFALGLGPTAVALVTDYVFGDDGSLRWSIALIGGGCCAAGLLVLVAGRGAYRRSVERAQADRRVMARGEGTGS